MQKQLKLLNVINCFISFLYVVIDQNNFHLGLES